MKKKILWKDHKNVTKTWKDHNVPKGEPYKNKFEIPKQILNLENIQKDSPRFATEPKEKLTQPHWTLLNPDFFHGLLGGSAG